MISKYLDLIKDTAIFALGALGSKLILFLMVPIYTNFMSTEQYGTVELLYTFMSLILPIVSLVIYDAVIRFGVSKYEKIEDVLANGLFVATLGSVVTVIITPLIGFYDAIGEWKWYLCFYVIFSMYSAIIQNYLKASNRNMTFAIISIIQTLSLAVLNIYCLCIKRMAVEGYMFSVLSSILISIVLMIVAGDVISALKGAKIKKMLMKDMISFSFPLIFNNLSWWLINSSDRIMVELMLGMGAVGIYTVAAKIPSLINVITSIFQQAWGISSIKEIETSNNSTFYGNIFYFLELIVVGATILFCSIIKPLMIVYVGEDFYGATKFIPLLLCAASFASLSGYWATMYSALKKSINNMITTIIAAVINIGLNYVCILYLGIWGAVIGTIGAYIVLSEIRKKDVKKHVNIKINDKLYYFNCFLMCIQAIAVSFFDKTVLVSVLALSIFILTNFRELRLRIRSL